MKHYAGSFGTEEEAVLAIKDLAPLLTEETEITVLTKSPMKFVHIRSGHDARYYTDAPVGKIYHGEGFLELLTALYQEELEEKALRHLTEKYMAGEILIFLGDIDPVKESVPMTPGSYGLPEDEGQYLRPDLKVTDVPDRDLEDEDALDIPQEEGAFRNQRFEEPYNGSVDERNPFSPD